MCAVVCREAREEADATPPTRTCGSDKGSLPLVIVQQLGKSPTEDILEFENTVYHPASNHFQGLLIVPDAAGTVYRYPACSAFV